MQFSIGRYFVFAYKNIIIYCILPVISSEKNKLTAINARYFI